MKVKTKNIPICAFRQVKPLAEGLYRYNALLAYGFGFNVKESGLVYDQTLINEEKDLLKFHGVVFLHDKTINLIGKTFKAHTLFDVGSGETIPI